MLTAIPGLSKKKLFLDAHTFMVLTTLRGQLRDSSSLYMQS